MAQPGPACLGERRGENGIEGDERSFGPRIGPLAGSR